MEIEVGSFIIDNLISAWSVISSYFSVFWDYCTTYIVGTIVRFNNPIIVAFLFVALFMSILKVKERVL